MTLFECLFSIILLLSSDVINRSVCTIETIENIQTLIGLHLFLLSALLFSIFSVQWKFKMHFNIAFSLFFSSKLNFKFTTQFYLQNKFQIKNFLYVFLFYSSFLEDGGGIDVHLLLTLKLIRQGVTAWE